MFRKFLILSLISLNLQAFETTLTQFLSQSLYVNNIENLANRRCTDYKNLQTEVIEYFYHDFNKRISKLNSLKDIQKISLDYAPYDPRRNSSIVVNLDGLKNFCSSNSRKLICQLRDKYFILGKNNGLEGLLNFLGKTFSLNFKMNTGICNHHMAIALMGGESTENYYPLGGFLSEFIMDINHNVHKATQKIMYILRVYISKSQAYGVESDLVLKFKNEIKEVQKKTLVATKSTNPLTKPYLLERLKHRIQAGFLKAMDHLPKDCTASVSDPKYLSRFMDFNIMTYSVKKLSGKKMKELDKYYDQAIKSKAPELKNARELAKHIKRFSEKGRCF